MVDDVLLRLYQEGRSAWPSVVVSRAAFDEHARDRLAPDELNNGHGADLYLALGCVQRHPQALAAFEKQYLSRVPDFIRRVDNSHTVASEVQQMLRERLLVGEGRPRIGDYSGRGPLTSWLRVVAVRAALELHRARKPEVFDDGRVGAEVLTTDDPELDYLRVRYAEEFQDAFTGALTALEKKELTILQLYLVDGLNIERIGTLYQVHRATVARWLATTRDRLYDDTSQRLRDRLQLNASEFESLVRLVRSQLDVSVRRILQEGQNKSNDGSSA